MNATCYFLAEAMKKCLVMWECGKMKKIQKFKIACPSENKSSSVYYIRYFRSKTC